MCGIPESILMNRLYPRALADDCICNAGHTLVVPGYSAPPLRAALEGGNGACPSNGTTFRDSSGVLCHEEYDPNEKLW
jgi:hypothetical protein